MTPKEEIAVLELLRQREAQFVKVWQCEDGIRRMLGLAAFPFAAVPELPSRRRVKRPLGLKELRARKSPSGSGVAEASVSDGVSSVRKLQSGEDAYRVVYVRGDGEEVSFVKDLDVIRKLFQLQYDGFKVLSVETVVFRSLDDWTSCQVLWCHDEA